MPSSRIEGLAGIPLCLDYYKWPLNFEGKADNNDGHLETVFVGDDLGKIDLYHFTSTDWHVCQYMPGSRGDGKARQLKPISEKDRSAIMTCHAEEFEQKHKAAVADQLQKKAALDKQKRSEFARHIRENRTTGLPQKAKELAEDGLKREITACKKEIGIAHKSKVCHSGWIMKIKFYSDMNFIVSCGLDSKIHIHSMTLNYVGKSFERH